MLGAHRVRSPVCAVVKHEPRGGGVLEKLVFGFGPLLRLWLWAFASALVSALGLDAGLRFGLG